MHILKFALYIPVLIALIPLDSSADEACSIIDNGQGGRPVVFFGGWKSQESDGQRWAQAAGTVAGKHCPGSFKFEGHGLHGAKSSQDSVLQANSGSIQSCVQKIQTYTGNQKITLVGHSDGSWAVNAIVNQLQSNDRKKIQLVLLDGNLQSGWGPQGSPASVHCYTPSSTEANSCQEIHWPSHGKDDPPYTTNMMAGICTGHCRPLYSDAQNCPQNLWRAHFTLVSSNVSCNLNSSNFNAQAYQPSMIPSLDFLGCGASAVGSTVAPPAAQ